MGATAPLTAERVLRRLEWQVIRRLEGRLQGNYRTALRGYGTDFRDVREYEIGDDVRHVDWNVTARMDEMYVREYSEDRELTAWLLLDHSASMGFGPVSRTKERVLCEVAATIAQLFVRGGNRVGALVYDDERVRTIPPRQGRNQVLALVEALLRPAAGRGTVTDLRTLLDTASRMIRRRSLVVLVSDFISQPGWERSMLRLSERHEVVAIRLVDPREFELPDAGLIVVEDAETGEQLMVDSSDPQFRRRLRLAGEEREKEIRDAARRAGVDLHLVTTDDDLVIALVRIVESRKRRRR
ncbi:MAG TPA: DUF58 domain-containing protein [Acidimicrobiales bacterium]|nr:DUF58 domain-containing protein [Acidimicrobiales bacterium]